MFVEPDARIASRRCAAASQPRLTVSLCWQFALDQGDYSPDILQTFDLGGVESDAETLSDGNDEIEMVEGISPLNVVRRRLRPEYDRLVIEYLVASLLWQSSLITHRRSACAGRTGKGTGRWTRSPS